MKFGNMNVIHAPSCFSQYPSRVHFKPLAPAQIRDGSLIVGGGGGGGGVENGRGGTIFFFLTQIVRVTASTN